jgi:hypothetical protein
MLNSRAASVSSGVCSATFDHVLVLDELDEPDELDELLLVEAILSPFIATKVFISEITEVK